MGICCLYHNAAKEQHTVYHYLYIARRRQMERQENMCNINNEIYFYPKCSHYSVFNSFNFISNKNSNICSALLIKGFACDYFFSVTNTFTSHLSLCQGILIHYRFDCFVFFGPAPNLSTLILLDPILAVFTQQFFINYVFLDIETIAAFLTLIFKSVFIQILRVLVQNIKFISINY